MLLAESELRSVIRESIMAEQRQKDYARLIREANDLGEDLDAMEDAEDDLKKAIESGDEEAIKAAIKDAEATVAESEFRMLQKHGKVLEENYDRQLLNEAGGILAASLLLAAPKIIELCVAGVAMMIGDKGVPHIEEKSEGGNIEGIAKEFADEHRPSADEIKGGKVMIDDHDHDDDHHGPEYNNKILNGLNKFAHAWHGGYVWLLKQILMTGYNVKYLIAQGKVRITNAFNKKKKAAAIEKLQQDKEAFKKKVNKFAENLLLVIVFILAIASGVGAAAAAMKGNAALSVLETVLAGVKYMELAPMKELLIAKAPEIISALWAAA